MTSADQVSANRANARASSGPKTPAGKAKSAKNALRHGLNIRVLHDPSLANDIDALVMQITGSGATAPILELARNIAEAQIDLRRVRAIRDVLIQRAFHDGPVEAAVSTDSQSRMSPIPTDITKQLAALERYERRALSRRKAAIRAFDHARAAAQS